MVSGTKKGTEQERVDAVSLEFSFNRESKKTSLVRDIASLSSYCQLSFKYTYYRSSSPTHLKGLQRARAPFC